MPDDFDARVEAVIFTAERPVGPVQIAKALQLAGAAPWVKQAVECLNEAYETSGRSFRIELLAGAYKVMTLPAFADVMDGLKKTRTSNKLSAAAIETLSIVAYKQPIIRGDIEAIRGVACGEVLKTLLERHLIKITGRADQVGHPVLYGTTKHFLETFGLGNLKDLPKVDQLEPPGL